jgi:hypothetical protein
VKAVKAEVLPLATEGSQNIKLESLILAQSERLRRA